MSVVIQGGLDGDAFVYELTDADREPGKFFVGIQANLLAIDGRCSRELQKKHAAHLLEVMGQQMERGLAVLASQPLRDRRRRRKAA